MTGIRLELANPHQFASPADYIEQHLAPVATELHRIANELLAPGATSAEEWAVDMVPPIRSADFQRLDRPLLRWAKHLSFDGAEYFSIPKELLRSKRLKVQLSATVYQHGGEPSSQAEFRLVREGGMIILGSGFSTTSDVPQTVTRFLPFGEGQGCVAPEKHIYYIEARSPGRDCVPVCRRFSMSFVYI